MAANQRDALRQADHELITKAVQGILETRAPIGQAIVMLMFGCAVHADTALGMLRSHSQNHNVTFRLIAEQIEDVTELSKSNMPARRLTLDGLVAEARHRIVDSAAEHEDGESTCLVKELGNSWC